ncbi:HD-GYP domain-containing protein [Emcibacter nanhaiensis]|uniref:HD-GYP domain-containing protein n=3 Tax=Pseudomonadota TaxID=1224 RepID=UPI00360F4C1C
MNTDNYSIFNSDTDEIVKNTVLLLIGLSDLYTKEHCIMVSELAARIAQRLGVLPGEIEKIKLAGYLHDIGKQAIPQGFISKPGKLSPQEYELVKTHVQVGVDVLHQLKVSPAVVRMVGEHHERLDGSGYPNCLRGSEISLGGQIIGVADVVSALVSKRTYRTASTADEVEKILMDLIPHQMDPEIVQTALDCLRAEVDEIFMVTDYAHEMQNAVHHYH